MPKLAINPKMIYGQVTIGTGSVLVKFRPYGFYVRNGVKRMRDYGRTLKNGKGMSVYEAMNWRLEEARESLNRELLRGIYGKSNVQNSKG